MFENIASIDIGTSSIKLTTVRIGLRDFQIKSMAYQDIDFDIEDSREAMGDAIVRLLEEEDIRGMKVITNLPMEKAIIRNISFPFSDVEKIAEAIPYEAEENIPFKMEDLILDFQSLSSGKDSEGRVLIAAAHKENIDEFLETLHSKEIYPIHMGMESNALFECYSYFNTIEEETLIQVDIGNNKSIINIIKDNRLLYTRSISVGINDIFRGVADLMKLRYSEAVHLYENLNLDLTSYENNVQRSFYTTLGLTKPKLKKIFMITKNAVDELIEQIFLTMKALSVDFGALTYSRVLLSGGGTNITGIGTLISQELNIPVVAHPFLDAYKEHEINTQFPIVFGTLLSYLKKRRSSINFLKGEFLPDVASSSKKIYYLSGAFGVMTLFVLMIYIISSLILSSKTSSQYNEIMRKQFKSYFRKDAPEDPLAGAIKILKKEKKEMEGISTIFPEDSMTLDLLNDILKYFPQDAGFDLKNLVINKRIIRIDGTASTSTKIDEFKEKLLQSKEFDSVTLNIKFSRKDEVRFSMNIKQKIAGKKSAGKN